MKNQARHTSLRPKKQENTDKLVLVRSTLLYGISIEEYKTDKTSINRGVVSTPTIVYYSNNTKCFVDYTNQLNGDIEKKIGEYYAQIAPGTTGSFVNGIYNDPTTKEISDISGVYRFLQINNGVVSFDVTSVTSLSSVTTRYDKKNFEDIPYFTSTSVKGSATPKTIIKNRFGKNTKNSFNYMGVIVGDYIKIADLTSSPIKILEINSDSDGNEFIVIDKRIDSVDLMDLQTRVDLFLEIKDTISDVGDLADISRGVGACIQNVNGVFLSCTDNHTISQCRLRSSKLNKITTELTLGTFCRTQEEDLAVQTNSTDTLIQITNSLASALTNASTVSGPVLKNGNSKNSFYGRPF